MKVGKNIITAIIVFFALSVFVIAQDSPPQKAPPGFGQGGPPGAGGQRRGPGFPPDHALNILSPEMRFDGKVVTGAPYSATATTESLQTLSNGARITHKTTASIHRDSQGRTRREVTLDSVGPFATAGEPAQLIFINDPVAGVHYILNQRDHTARKMGPPPSREERDHAARKMGPSPNKEDGPRRRPPHHPMAFELGKTESLGKQEIEGVEAEGVRSTITISEGRIGNDRPIEIVSERWYSPELQTVVLSKHNDPRFGETVYRLVNINRAEPAQSLFEVSSDYKIEEGRPGFLGSPRPMRRMKKPGEQ